MLETIINSNLLNLPNLPQLPQLAQLVNVLTFRAVGVVS